MTLIEFTGVDVRARCESGGPNTHVLLTVASGVTDSANGLRALSLRFCGEVIEAKGPAGWTTVIEREKGRDEVAADVKWELADAAFAHSSTPRGVGDFAVTLRGKWRRGLGYDVAFRESAVGTSSPHDCPYPFR
jgi:hypothetical protein